MLQKILSALFPESRLALQTSVRLQRLMNEGFRELWFSLGLLATGLLLTTIFLHDKAVLESAIASELLKTVGTRQEPSSDVSETGLIAAALASVNGGMAPDEWGCKDDKQTGPNPCATVDELPNELARSMQAAVTSAFTSHKEDEPWSTETKLFEHVPRATLPSWPNLDRGPLCERSGDTFLMVPVTTASSWISQGVGEFPQSVVRAAALSSSLQTSLNALESRHRGQRPYKYLVQAYFISPDNLLRFWTAPGPDVHACELFPRYRLWAAKDYFEYFWRNPAARSHTTFTYIDYAGNGLVRTSCSALELPLRNPEYPNGELLGTVCLDFALPDTAIGRMRRQLFFSTALVRIPVAGTPGKITADVELPAHDVDTPDEGITSRIWKAASAAPFSSTSPPEKLTPSLSETEQRHLDRAIDMQSTGLTEAVVTQKVLESLPHGQSPSLFNGITSIQLNNRTAFLLPLGEEAGGKLRAMFFLPRTPRLPITDDLLGVLGLLLLGASVGIGWHALRLRTKADALDERLAIFRNLQVGIVRVDTEDRICEANDRAEEIFGRKLRKPGLVDRSKFRFKDLIDHRLIRPPHGQFRYIEPDEIETDRRGGRAYAYYARLNSESLPSEREVRWLHVLGTPVLKPNDASESENEINMVEIFATVSEVPREMDMILTHELNALLRSREAPAQTEYSTGAAGGV